MKFSLSVRDCGDGLWIPLPEPIVNSLELKEGDSVNLTACNDTLILRKSNMSHKEYLESILIPEEKDTESLGISQEDLDSIGDVEFE